jgi:hypothetical protein
MLRSPRVGSLAREAARVALRLSIRRDPGRRIERESFTVTRQSVVSLKSASKVSTHFCASPQFHVVDRQTSGVRTASPPTGDPDSLVLIRASYPLVPRLRPTESRCGPHSLRSAPNNGDKTQCRKP